MISGNVPNHLVVGARTGFLTGMRRRTYPYQRVAMTVPISAASIALVDLGAAPMPKESSRGITVQDFIEKTKTVTPTDWDITVWLSYNAMKDDQTASLERKVRQAGDNFQKHMNKRVFQALDAGDGTSYGACYDSYAFFYNSHIDKGANYQTAQDNVHALALSLDNFETVMVAAQNYVDDQGEFTNYLYDLLVVPPAYEREAAQIAVNAEAYDTANREMNPYAGKLQYVVDPNIASTAWMLVASSEETKPLLLVMREEPNLQDAWFDPKAPDGGRYYFKFFARYEVHYGDWRLAAMGNT